MKDIKTNDICYIIEHSVYGDPNAPLNEPYVVEVSVTKVNANRTYNCRGTEIMSIYLEVPEKQLYQTKQEAEDYIKEHRNEIIKESFENHRKWLKKMKEEARKPHLYE